LFQNESGLKVAHEKFREPDRLQSQRAPHINDCTRSTGVN
jgi:hypothetical protein